MKLENQKISLDLCHRDRQLKLFFLFLFRWAINRMERFRDRNIGLHMDFLDLEKVYDKVGYLERSFGDFGR